MSPHRPSANGNAGDVATLRSLEAARPLYILPADPLAEEVLIPAFESAMQVDCMVGFFSSHVLASLAPGLATYIASSDHSFRLIISPLLSADDQEAIERGLRSAEDVGGEVLEQMIVTEDLLQRHTLECLSWLLRNGRIEIRVALMKTALFHPKVWLFHNHADIVAAHGSSNLTYSGIRENIEQVAVSRSWQDANQHFIGQKLQMEFENLWENRSSDCVVVPIPRAIREHLLVTYSSKIPPTEEDLRAIYRRADEMVPGQPIEAPDKIARTGFEIPSWLRYEDGPFEHQGKAVDAWCQAGFRGILEMATGSGKTITSMIGAYRLYEKRKPLLIVVAAPYIPLIQQWCGEIEQFGLVPANLSAATGARNRARQLQRLRRRLHSRASGIEVVVVSQDTLCTQEFLDAIASFRSQRLLIADEVHNLGRQSFISAPPEFFEFRLGLSATPNRQYDAKGTEALQEYFGPIVFEFTLEEAIGNCLVEYDYYVHPVKLTEREMGDWLDLTGTIKSNAWRIDEGEPDTYMAKLLRDRRALLEMASNKISMLETLIDREDPSRIKYTLIYASDKGPNQLTEVNRLLRKRNILFHQLTANETSNREDTNRIIRSFQDGEIQVLTAKRVLDEGVNIPQVCTAYILASTTVERQWVQRRGRLLRRCSSIGKDGSVVHDLLALPPHLEEGLDADAKTLVHSELLRAQEFARLARNSGRPDGALALIDRLADAVYL